MQAKTHTTRKGFGTWGILLLLGSLLLVAVLGTYSYFKLEEIITKVNQASVPDEKLLAIRGIRSDLFEAENKLIAYRLGEEEADLERFIDIRWKLDGKLEAYGTAARSSGEWEVAYRLDSLVRRKFQVQWSMLRLEMDRPETEDLTNLGERITAQVEKLEPKARAEHLPEDMPVQNGEEETADTVEGAEEKEGRRGFFARVFKRKEKRDAGRDPIPENPKTPDPVSEDPPPAPPNDPLPLLLQSELENYQQRREEAQRQLSEEELALAQEEQAVAAEIEALLDQEQAKELKRVDRRNAEAETSAMEMNRLFILFCIALAALIGAIALSIFFYNRNNRKYRTEIEAAQREAVALAKARQDFLATMSHEVRTPMNAILGFSSLMLRSDLTTEQQQRLELVHGSAKHLLGIVNDVLDMSKLQAGGITFQQEPMTLTKELQLCLSLVRPEAENKGLQLRSKLDSRLPEPVWGDPMRLRQVVFNLLNNAIRFTETGEVALEAEAIEEKAGEVRVRVSVKDTGIGIPEADQERIFEEFVQVESGSLRSHGGTGLGLPICKRIVEGQGGTISVYSTPGKGTHISFELGFALEGEMVDGKAEEQAAAVLEAAPQRVLVVDDAWFNRRLLVEILSARGVEVEEAENGERALEWLGKAEFDVVLLDIRMPGTSGLEVLQQVRAGKSGAEPHLPILALTAAATQEELEACRAAGCNAILTKPFKEAELAQLLHLPAPSPAETPSENKLYSLDRLNKMGRGDQDFVRKMVASYRDMLQAALQKWREGAWEENLQDLSDTAHKLAPPTKHLGADHLFELLKALEKEAEGAAKPTTIQGLLDEIQLFSQQLLPALEQELNKDPHG